MKTKLNILIILALVAALAGGIASPAKAEGEPSITDMHVDLEPSIAGFPILKAYATFTSAGSSFTCTVDYGDGSGVQDGTVEGGNRCNGPEHTYATAGSYLVTFTVTDVTNSLMGSGTVTHEVVTPDAKTVLSFNGVTNATNALSGKDNSYATFGAAGGAITLDIGALAADANLTLYHTTTGPSCQVTALSPTGPDVISIGSTTRGAASTVFSLPPYFQSLTITCPAAKKGATLGLDAVQVTPYTGTTRYGVGIVQAGPPPTNPAAALGAPDGKYATFANGQSVSLALGMQPVQNGKLTIYYAKGAPVCEIFVADTGGVPWDLGTTTAGAATSVYNIPEPIAMVTVDCSSLGAKEVFSLDAVKFEPVAVPEGYAKHVVFGGALNPFAAVWAPDGNYAQSEYSGMLILDMGAPVRGTLTLYHAASTTYCQVAASMDPELTKGTIVVAGVTTPGATTSTFTSPNDFQYVVVACMESFGLDAVKVDPQTPAKWYATMPFDYAFGDNAPGIFATGAPDGQYAPGTGNGLVLDMGAAFHGTLTFHYASGSGCYLAASTSPDISSGTPVVFGATTPGATTSTFTSPGDFRYVMAMCQTGGGLDAVEVDPATPAKWYATMPVNPSDMTALLATGAPDGLYAPVNTNTGIVLDMGAPFHGQVTVYHSAASTSCMVGPSDADGTVSTVFGATTAGATFSTLFVSEDLQYMAIGAMCGSASTVFDLDAVEVTPVDIMLDGYAISVLGADASVKNATAALGAPDGSYATVPAVSGNIGLDLGAPFSGLLTITHASGNPACNVYGAKDLLDLLTKNLIGSMASGMTYTILPISTATFPDGIRFVEIDCQQAQKGSLSLDAVRVQPAPTPTGNGLYVFGIDGNIKNQEAALGAPNGAYATIGSPSGFIILYMGAPYTGGTLTIYHSTTSPSCAIYVTEALGVLGQLGYTTSGAPATTISLNAGQSAALVGVQCTSLAKRAAFQLDAVEIH